MNAQNMVVIFHERLRSLLFFPSALFTGLTRLELSWKHVRTDVGLFLGWVASRIYGKTGDLSVGMSKIQMLVFC